MGEIKARLSAKMGVGFHKSKLASRERYGYVRTLLHRDKPIPLSNLYVPINFTYDHEIISDTDLVKTFASPCKILIQGTAGGGKTIFMRYLHLAVCDSSRNTLPIFFELRNVNANPDISLMENIRKSIHDNLADCSIDLLKTLLKDRNAVLILDGFDEINYSLRESFAKQISDLCREIPESSIILSSRPDDFAESIDPFSIYHARPFSKSQAIELLGKLPYDSTVTD